MKKSPSTERMERLQKAKDAALPPKNLGKCEDCGADIVTEDKEGRNVHCRNGHVIAIGLKKDGPHGLITAQELASRQDQVLTIPVSDESRLPSGTVEIKDGKSIE